MVASMVTRGCAAIVSCSQVRASSREASVSSGKRTMALRLRPQSARAEGISTNVWPRGLSAGSPPDVDHAASENVMSSRPRPVMDVYRPEMSNFTPAWRMLESQVSRTPRYSGSVGRRSIQRPDMPASVSATRGAIRRPALFAAASSAAHAVIHVSSSVARHSPSAAAATEPSRVR